MAFHSIFRQYVMNIRVSTDILYENFAFFYSLFLHSFEDFRKSGVKIITKKKSEEKVKDPEKILTITREVAKKMF